MKTVLTAGVDDAGRGPLAGSVFAAAVILPPGHNLPGLTDSKKLSEKKRNELAAQIKAQAVAWSVARADVQEIAELNILNATLLAMTRAVQGLAVPPPYSPKPRATPKCMPSPSVTRNTASTNTKATAPPPTSPPSPNSAPCPNTGAASHR